MTTKLVMRSQTGHEDQVFSLFLTVCQKIAGILNLCYIRTLKSHILQLSKGNTPLLSGENRKKPAKPSSLVFFQE